MDGGVLIIVWVAVCEEDWRKDSPVETMEDIVKS